MHADSRDDVRAGGIYIYIYIYILTVAYSCVRGPCHAHADKRYITYPSCKAGHAVLLLLNASNGIPAEPSNCLPPTPTRAMLPAS